MSNSCAAGDFPHFLRASRAGGWLTRQSETSASRDTSLAVDHGINSWKSGLCLRYSTEELEQEVATGIDTQSVF